MRRAIEKRAGLVPWKNNALRHSFISYFYAATHDENRVAANAGNSPAMVHRHYRALTTKEDAERYFAIQPFLNKTTPRGNSIAEPLGALKEPLSYEGGR
jgi:hypothetical protein